MQHHHQEAIELLKKIISIPSYSKHENDVASLLFQNIKKRGLSPIRINNNIILKCDNFDKNKPNILLNSHIDTVKPVDGWSTDPHKPIIKDGKIYGLGSNDAGASLLSLLESFIYLNARNDLSCNLLYAATAEEEISGRNGIESIKEEIGEIHLGIIGEPTNMQMAIAEKGLMVLDCISNGVAGHAARDEGENAIYSAINDIDWIKSYEFDKKSQILGSVKMSVTEINGGYKHNVIPDLCRFVVDVRTNELYTNQEIFAIIDKNTESTITPRSFRLNSSGIDNNHPFVLNGIKKGLRTFGSPTLSDQALLDFPTIKIGPGESKRSHTANEFIYTDEILNGIKTYIDLLINYKI